ncbi:hypothetical protein [Hymenobacter sp. B1770]|uniref:hypothetical protein n=1 Tax=Hymenobacter sp. B1770 TaxID=1718788 RepID=UPI003CEE0AEA
METLALPALYNQAPRVQQNLILRHDLPARARRVVLESRPVAGALGVFYVGVLTWEVPRVVEHRNPRTGARERRVEVVPFTKHLGVSARDWQHESLA